MAGSNPADAMTATRTIGAIVALALVLATAVHVVGVRAFPVQPQSATTS